jgi:hypothetical protein
MACFNYPPSRLKKWIGELLFPLLTSRTDMRFIARLNHHPLWRIPGIAGISAEIFLPRCHDRFRNLSLQNRLQLTYVMPVCPGYDERQRDATPLYQDMPL